MTLVFVALRECDSRTFLREAMGTRATDAACPTGDDCYSAIETTHAFPRSPRARHTLAALYTWEIILYCRFDDGLSNWH